MDFGFIQAAAPASPPGPLTDAAAAGASGDAAGAFDAALAQTLASAPSPAATGTAAPNAARVPQPQWLLTTLFAGSLAGTASAEDATAAGEAPVTDDSIDNATTDDAAPDAAADIVVAPVVVADMPNAAAMPTGIVPGGGAEGATAGAPEGVSAPAAQRLTSAAGAEASDVATRSASAQYSHAATGDTAPATTGETTPPAAALAPAPAPAVEVTTDPAAVERSMGMRAEARGESAREFREFRAPADAVSSGLVGRAPRIQVAPAPDATTAVDAAGQSAAAPGAPIAAAVAADARGVAMPAPGPSSADGTRTSNAVEAIASQGNAAALFSAGQDAPMTGGDQSNGQGRPSHDFMRFAAALAMVTPAAGDEGGRAQVAGVTSAPATPQPPAAPAAPVAPAASVPTAPTETPGPDNVGRLVQAMRVMARPGAWEANVRLNPEHLGEVTIAVRVERNTVSAVVNAESAGVCEWLEGQEQTMREGMAEHGLELDRFVVQRDGRRREAPEQEQPQGRHAPRGRQPAPSERFEIVV